MTKVRARGKASGAGAAKDAARAASTTTASAGDGAGAGSGSGKALAEFDDATGSRPNLKVVNYTRKKSGCCYRVAQFLFGMFVCHYMFWWVIGVAFLLALVAIGPLGEVLAVICILLYLPSYMSPAAVHTGRPWHWLRRTKLWHLILSYFSLEIVRTHELDPDRQFVFGVHPHGILIMSRVATYGGAWEAMFGDRDFRILAASPIFWLPGCREISLYMNAVDAGRKTAKRIMWAGKDVMVYPGGSKEIFETDPNSKTTTLMLSTRLGFIKLAMQHGAPLVPTFIFGEKWMFSRLNLPKGIVSFMLNVLRIPLLVFWGRLFTCMPRRRKMGVVYGAPIEAPLREEPTTEELKAVHAKYCAAVKDLFETYKGRFGYADDETLVIK